MIKNFLLGAIGLSALGLIDTIYLTYQHYTANSLFCNILSGCDLVTKSAYNNIAGLPIALLGILYYLSIFSLTIYLYRNQTSFAEKKPVRLFFSLTVTGVAFSIWLTYLQAIVIEAWCQYCLFSAGLTLVLFIISLILLKLSRQAPPEDSPRAGESAL
ncbi:MAG: hypothetical protein COV08_00305 [Candidatus Vogelbacteria bacterium CG10_big_fil_rev_8_21_14_0_10_49_38]|uniref:Vitamin K epoxide reductase domain-containing protein n=1 Tax=Candidatus Vogelbacteria bacterium CG10_big_fil_rev_8_21_14_0_10_49_38 TaxID=1975043 RepID=A0A2H0RIP4_9BACT|nr:MAG: hypothetical protein BK006_00300 [bacterium CG10_49_38]PIR46363.1 MAG: hypothetical protein COV08_00305 [Candidatus Vogelbacteria bacterium CG10_big_fil_rev_8_21_14_0_10_49_38]